MVIVFSNGSWPHLRIRDFFQSLTPVVPVLFKLVHEAVQKAFRLIGGVLGTKLNTLLDGIELAPVSHQRVVPPKLPGMFQPRHNAFKFRGYTSSTRLCHDCCDLWFVLVSPSKAPAQRRCSVCVCFFLFFFYFYFYFFFPSPFLFLFLFCLYFWKYYY